MDFEEAFCSAVVQTTCTVVGAAAGAVAGCEAGGAVGATVGTFALPGGGTVGGAAAGCTVGAVGGGVTGAASGQAFGEKAADSICGGGGDNEPPDDGNDDDCKEEWESAREICRGLIFEQLEQRAGRRKKRSVTGVTGGFANVEECARGLVSERCGGNRVE